MSEDIIQGEDYPQEKVVIVNNVNCGCGNEQNGQSASPAPVYADFFAVMPPSNQNAIDPGGSVAFPYDGPYSRASIVRIDDSSFRLINAGTYQVMFQVSVVGEGQLVLALNGMELPNTVSGRFAQESQIVGMAVIIAPEGAVLSVCNPADSPYAMRLRNSAGGGLPVSAHLLINKLA
jgi:hypothetical protein